MGFSLVSLFDSFLRRSFLSSGLHPHTFPIDSDTTMNCWLPNSLSPSNPNPNPKPRLLLIHGFGPTATWQWRLQVRPLSRHFDLVVPDLVFFGGSTTRSRHRSEAFQASSLVRLLEVIGLTGRFSVVGTSYGGFVAYHVARICGERVDRVVIASSDVLKGEADDRGLMDRAGVGCVEDLMIPRNTESMRTLMKLAVYRPPYIMPDFVLRDVIRNLYNENIEEKMELIKGVTLGKKDKFQISPLSQEVLIVWGEHDRIFPLEKAFELKKQLGEKARLEVLENTAHVPQVEDPDRFNAIVLNFLLDGPKSSM